MWAELLVQRMRRSREIVVCGGLELGWGELRMRAELLVQRMRRSREIVVCRGLELGWGELRMWAELLVDRIGRCRSMAVRCSGLDLRCPSPLRLVVPWKVGGE